MRSMFKFEFLGLAKDAVHALEEALQQRPSYIGLQQ